MSSRALLVFIASIACTAAAYAQNAPEALRGKSVVVSWTEQRSLRFVGEASFRDTNTPFSKTIYLSSAGRPFIRTSATPGRVTGSSDSVGASGGTHAGGARQVTFSGGALQMTATMTSGGARHIEVTFDGSGCAARVTTAKQVGSEIIRSKSLVNGKPIEIRSVAVSGTSCSVRAGNAFAE